ncbi:hypothetical protein GUITHDRAFT_153569 [Guillardia theta CCMP2712]|uniref:Uncharacterized protein n=2 Tax=Guillardia theta TaxID=55529 RepID=L1J1X7_GUITC|nr:hypothetical protein GUITHDRAFT_153569 [Guillardia theta CCMP2712]EKX42282.1 hypothetical protein GUITHDRAFT_153569 [Guillardia theta CCMP2712]|eukprot:XP_005829262.1 hypothetical protein GUITHDRAFT_153569 [Guillardia theta CCMP2712]
MAREVRQGPSSSRHAASKQVVLMEDIEYVPVRVPSDRFKGARLMSLSNIIEPGMLTINPGSSTGLGSVSGEQGKCFADISCGTDCGNCPHCHCLMGDGREVACAFGKCSCVAHCKCAATSECPMACGTDYSPDLCGQTICRAGKCYEAFNLPMSDPEWRIRKA